MHTHNLITIACINTTKQPKYCGPHEKPCDPGEKPQDSHEKNKYDTAILLARVVDCESGLPVPCVKVKFSCNNKHAKIKHLLVETDEAGLAQTDVTYPHIDIVDNNDNIEDAERHRREYVFTASTPDGYSDSIEAPLARADWPGVRIYNATQLPLAAGERLNNYTINAAQIAQGPFVIVEFPPADDFLDPNSRFDVQTLFWDSFAAGAQTRINGDFRLVELTSSAFPQAQIFSNGAHTVTYTIREATNPESVVNPDETQTVTVSGSSLTPPSLPAPTWLPTTATRINFDVYQAPNTGFSVVIPPTAGVIATDTYSIYLDIYTKPVAPAVPVFVRTVVVADAVVGVPPATGTLIPETSVANLNGYNGRLYYTVLSAAAGSVLQTSAIRSVSIDTVPPGGSLLVEDGDDCGCRDDGYHSDRDHDRDYDHDRDHDRNHNPRRSGY